MSSQITLKNRNGDILLPLTNNLDSSVKDIVITENSEKMITSGAVYTALQTKADAATVSATEESGTHAQSNATSTMSFAPTVTIGDDGLPETGAVIQLSTDWQRYTNSEMVDFDTTVTSYNLNNFAVLDKENDFSGIINIKNELNLLKDNLYNNGRIYGTYMPDTSSEVRTSLLSFEEDSSFDTAQVALKVGSNDGSSSSYSMILGTPSGDVYTQRAYQGELAKVADTVTFGEILVNSGYASNVVLAMPEEPTYDGTNVTIKAGTVFAVPNGRDSNGRAISTIVTLEEDKTINQSTYNGNVYFGLDNYGRVVQTTWGYHVVEDITKETVSQYHWYYDKKTNYQYNGGADGTYTLPTSGLRYGTVGIYNLSPNAATTFFKYSRPLTIMQNVLDLP